MEKRTHVSYVTNVTSVYVLASSQYTIRHGIDKVHPEYTDVNTSRRKQFYFNIDE